MKKCPRCKVTRELGEFYKNRSQYDGLQTYCKPCWKEMNPPSPERQAYARAHYRANKRRHKDWTLRREFGITHDQWDDLKAAQGDACAICGTVFSDKTLPYVDHNHVNGEVRGLLCRACNSVLGYAKDNPAILREAIWYLEHPQTLLQEAI